MGDAGTAASTDRTIRGTARSEVTTVNALVARARRIHPVVADGALAALLMVAAAGQLATPYTGPRPDTIGGWKALAVAAVGILPLAVRRLAPLTVLLVIGAIDLIGPLLDVRDTTAQAASITIAAYTLVAYGRAWRAAVAAVVVSAVYLQHIGPWLAPWPVTLYNLVFLGLVLYAGLVQSRRRASAEALRAQEAELEAGRERVAELAVGEERARIARELHDVVAHGVELMVSRADAAARELNGDDDRSQREIGAIEDAGRGALVELRRLLGVLRRGNHLASETQALPRLADIWGLVERSRASGLRVELQIDSTLDDVPAAVGLAAYRIVQEALTNVARHSGGGEAQVTIIRRDGEVLVDVVDEGADGDSEAAEPRGGGHGLIGMRERAELLGGSLTVGRRSEGGFAVRAALPLGPPAARATEVAETFDVAASAGVDVPAAGSASHVLGAPLGWLRAHPVAMDLLMVGILGWTTWLELHLVPPPAHTMVFGPHRSTVVVLSLLIVGALLLRRLLPLSIVVAQVAMRFTLALLGVPFPTSSGNAILVGIYGVGAIRGGAAAASAAAVAMAATLPRLWSAEWGRQVAILVSIGWAAWIGYTALLVRKLRDDVKEAVAELERQRDLEVRGAIRQERIRVAREMHDVVAHSVSLMTVQAGAARSVVGLDHERARRALDAVRAAGQQALEEMDIVLTALRGGADDQVPPPDRRDVASLVEQSADSGLHVSLEVEGKPKDLDEGLELSVFRIVQEALTNVRKHSAGAPAEVVLRYG